MWRGTPALFQGKGTCCVGTSKGCVDQETLVAKESFKPRELTPGERKMEGQKKKYS